ncbi:MAG: dihydrofolate reductase family protein [Candidatus Gracilibacteria bacterium]|nr:dihydrofolate reductase family protein [Candidatus Gracilibacteria bacterium]
MKITLYIAQSIDGFVATKDGGIAWLDSFNKIPNEDYGYQKFIDSIDTVIQGNTTYKQFQHSYDGKYNFVFSKNAAKLSAKNITFVNKSVTKFLKNLDKKNHKNIWLVGGPNLLTEFLNKGHLDECILFTMPILLGDGIPLFQNIKKIPKFKLLKTKEYKNGVIESHYSAT